MQVQIRYADTQEQKSLKQQTQAARQFRSAEYEWASQNYRPGHPNEFEQYLGTHPTVPIQGQRWAHSAMRQAPATRSPLGAAPFSGTTHQANAGADSEIKDDKADDPPAIDSAHVSEQE